jgi:hypothetical protein
MTFDDPMWNEFRPLWTDMPVADNQVLVAGGYGLFLKQRWLLENREHLIIVPLENWQDSAPRVTKDLDLILGLDLLASPEEQGEIVQALVKNGFKVVEKNARWQFEKNLAQERKILLDLHAKLPNQDDPNLVMDKRIRVKHKSSLGDEGVHGLQNPEAVGSNIHAFNFTIEGTSISVPNPVTWSLMKLIATRDRLFKAEDAKRDQKDREFHRGQAIKHVMDVARVVAMTTRDERDRAVEIIDEIRENTCFSDAITACEQFFKRNDGWGTQVTSRLWRDEDFTMIKETLTGWFSI